MKESCQDYYNNEKSLEGCIAFVYLCQIVHVFVHLLLIYATSQFYQNLSPLIGHNLIISIRKIFNFSLARILVKYDWCVIFPIEVNVLVYRVKTGYSV